MITNEQISELEIKIKAKIHEDGLVDHIRRIQIETLQAIKFGERVIEDKPAEYREEKDPNDETKTINVLVSTATMKRVFDVSPRSRDDTTEELDEVIREKLFNKINTLY